MTNQERELIEKRVADYRTLQHEYKEKAETADRFSSEMKYLELSATYGQFAAVVDGLLYELLSLGVDTNGIAQNAPESE